MPLSAQFACDIQVCLERFNYSEKRCRAVIERFRSCVEEERRKIEQALKQGSPSATRNARQDRASAE